MTVCIAVLCEDSQKVVVAADRMLTGGDVEFEQDSQKLYAITERCVVLTAGSALDQVDLLRDTQAGLQSSRSPSVQGIVAKLKGEFATARQGRAEELISNHWD